MSHAAALPFGAFGTRFKVDKARQREWLQNPALDERDAWPAGIAVPLADVARPRADQDADQASPCPSPPLHGTGTALPCSLGDCAAQRGARVRACSVVNALEGERGDRAYAAVEDGDLVLRRTNGDVLARMRLSGLELVDIGERRVVIVPKLAPTEIALDGLGLLEVEEEQDFWDMIPWRRATHRNIRKAKPQSAYARPSAGKLPKRLDSRRTRLPAIPEVPRAEAPATDSSTTAVAPLGRA